MLGDYEMDHLKIQQVYVIVTVHMATSSLKTINIDLIQLAIVIPSLTYVQ